VTIWGSSGVMGRADGDGLYMGGSEAREGQDVNLSWGRLLRAWVSGSTEHGLCRYFVWWGVSGMDHVGSEFFSFSQP
jgi:hypothetical protein